MPSLRSLLAEEGDTFENSFVSYPICRPSRATTLIGPLLPKPPHNGPSWAEQYLARRARGAAYNAAMFVESAVYVDGRRITTGTPGEACRACHEPGKFAWINLREPSIEEFVSVAGELGLDELAVEEAIEPDQRPKIERYGERLFVVLRSARYVEGAQRVQFGGGTRLCGTGLHHHGPVRRSSYLECTPREGGRRARSAPARTEYGSLRDHEPDRRRLRCGDRRARERSGQCRGGGVGRQHRGLEPGARSLPRGDPLPPGDEAASRLTRAAH